MRNLWSAGRIIFPSPHKDLISTLPDIHVTRVPNKITESIVEHPV